MEIGTVALSLHGIMGGMSATSSKKILEYLTNKSTTQKPVEEQNVLCVDCVLRNVSFPFPEH